MRTNCDLTIYNCYLVNGAETYQRTVIQRVMWENRKARNVLASGGNLAADQAVVYIPLARGLAYLAPKAWLANKSGHWTLQVGDVIVKGLVTDTIGPSFTISALKAKYDDVLVISSVDTMDMGSASLQHWKVSAK